LHFEFYCMQSYPTKTTPQDCVEEFNGKKRTNTDPEEDEDRVGKWSAQAN